MKDVVARRDERKVVALTSRLFRDFQRLDRIVMHWKEAYDEVHAAGRHYTCYRYLQAYADLVVVADGLRHDEVQRMTDEQLKERMLRDITAIIQAHPELAVNAARKIGWCVEPTDSCDKDQEQGVQEAVI